MKENNTPKKKKYRTKNSIVTIIVFWVCLILVLLPVAYFGEIFYTSWKNTHSPVLGNRYEGDLDPAIQQSSLDTINDKVKGLEGVEDVEVTLKTGTVRVYANINDDATSDIATAKASEIYTLVSEELDPSVYFTKTEDKKMYDLEIHVFTLPEKTDAEGENFVYVIETKTSSMSEPQSQVVSVAKDEALAQQLRDDVEARKAAAEATEAPADSTDGTVELSGGDVQSSESTDTQE